MKLLGRNGPLLKDSIRAGASKVKTLLRHKLTHFLNLINNTGLSSSEHINPLVFCMLLAALKGSVLGC